jgi:hypothetical protein
MPTCPSSTRKAYYDRHEYGPPLSSPISAQTTIEISFRTWSEESREPRFADFLGIPRLIPIFSPEEQWSQRSIVLRVRRAGRISTRV